MKIQQAAQKQKVKVFMLRGNYFYNYTCIYSYDTMIYFYCSQWKLINTATTSTMHATIYGAFFKDRKFTDCIEL